MKPQTIGRVLGIGVRLAGTVATRAAGEGLRGAGSATAAVPDSGLAAGSQRAGVETGRAAGKTAGKAAGSLARGAGGFLRPFTRVGGILWLEVTGAFFLLFAAVLLPAAWHARPSHWNGPFDRNFVVAAGIAAVFLYFGVSSFWRAGRR